MTRIPSRNNFSEIDVMLTQAPGMNRAELDQCAKTQMLVIFAPALLNRLATRLHHLTIWLELRAARASQV